MTNLVSMTSVYGFSVGCRLVRGWIVEVRKKENRDREIHTRASVFRVERMWQSRDVTPANNAASVWRWFCRSRHHTNITTAVTSP